VADVEAKAETKVEVLLIVEDLGSFTLVDVHIKFEESGDHIV